MFNFERKFYIETLTLPNNIKELVARCTYYHHVCTITCLTTYKMQRHQGRYEQISTRCSFSICIHTSLNQILISQNSIKVILYQNMKNVCNSLTLINSWVGEEMVHICLNTLLLWFGVLGIAIIAIDTLLVFFGLNLMFLVERNYSGNKNQHRKTKLSFHLENNH